MSLISQKIDALPLLFPHDHEDKERDPQAPLDLRWGGVRLSYERPFVSSLSAAFARELKVVGPPPPIYARATPNGNFLWAWTPAPNMLIGGWSMLVLYRIQVSAPLRLSCMRTVAVAHT